MRKTWPLWLCGIVIVIVAIMLVVSLIHPAISPFPNIRDSDLDGVVDTLDIFPWDASEWEDSDGDGYGDNGDAFPTSASEWRDSDNDGYGDNCDAFPYNATEWEDLDGDGYGDNFDLLPLNPDEWEDSDGDGVPDNLLDAFPDDPLEWRDIDGDGVGDNDDFFDNGNGLVSVTVDLYIGGYEDTTYIDKLDPYFVITVSESDGADIREVETFISPIFMDSTHLYMPENCSHEFDVADDYDVIFVNVSVYDAKENRRTPDDELIDYSESNVSKHSIHTLEEPFMETWHHDGTLDGNSHEKDCLLEISCVLLHAENTTAGEVHLELSFEKEVLEGWAQNGSSTWNEMYMYLPDWQVWNDTFELRSPSSYFRPDFANFSYVYADWGSQQIKDYHLTIKSIVLENTTLMVYVEKVGPPPGALPKYSPCHPFDFVRVRNTHLGNLEISDVMFLEYFYHPNQPPTLGPAEPFHQYWIGY